MLGITHLVAGAAAGAAFGDRRRGRAALVAMASHAALDLVPHHDDRLGLTAQALLGGLGLGTLTATCGVGSPLVAAALAGAAPDAEVVVWMLRGRRGGMLFPTHWQRRHRAGEHPWQLPGPRLPIGAEVAVSLAGLVALCLLGRRRAAAVG